MEDFNPRSPIRLSDIDNLLQESIFESSDGAKLVEYLKKKRGGGRVRLQNIFQQVPVQRAQFNFNLDTTDPTPLPASPEPTTSGAPQNGVHLVVPSTSVPQPQVVNNIVEYQGDAQQVVATSATPVVITATDNSPRIPVVVVNDLDPNKKMVKQIVLKSPGPMNALSRQVLINQYQRTNAAKCELLRHLTSSTPKPESNGSLGRISTFTQSISPITEGGNSPITPVDVIPSSQPHVPALLPPVQIVEIVAPPSVATQEVLAPCSQAVPDCTPKKVVVLQTVVEPYPPIAEMVIPETPSPKKVPEESPKAPHPTHIQPRRLSTTFKQLQGEELEFANGHITSDESDAEEQPNGVEGENTASNSILLKSILKDTSMGSGRRNRHSFRVSFSRQLVQQREISPAPSIPEADYNDSNSTDDSDCDDSDAEDNDYQVVDEVYTDDDGEEAEHRDEYEELKNRICELNQHHSRRSMSPLIDVVKETPVQWFETTTPTKRRDQQDSEEQQFPPPTTAKKDNKTNLQLVDIITDWDDEEDEEEGEHSASNAEIEPPQEHRASEMRASTQSNHHETNLETMDISSSNLEDSVERLVELPPAPNALSEEEGVLPEEHIYPAAVDEQMPAAIIEESVSASDSIDYSFETAPESVVASNEEQVEATERVGTPEPVEQLEELPPPPATPGDDEQQPPEDRTSPERVITPPVQFTNSAKRRFIQENEDALISRLQNDLPLSQASPSELEVTEEEAADERVKSYEKVSETLMEIAQSFRDQPPVLAPPVVEPNRKVVQQRKKGKKSVSTDPVTASYFEAIEKTFAKPMAPAVQGRKTEQKRKLYDATLSEATEDEATVSQIATPPAEVVVAPAKSTVEPKLRNLKVVLQKLRIEDYSRVRESVPPNRKEQSEAEIQPKEPESERQTVAPPEAAASAAAVEAVEPSKPDVIKRQKGRPRKKQPEPEPAVSVDVGSVAPAVEAAVPSKDGEVKRSKGRPRKKPVEPALIPTEPPESSDVEQVLSNGIEQPQLPAPEGVNRQDVEKRPPESIEQQTLKPTEEKNQASKEQSTEKNAVPADEQVRAPEIKIKKKKLKPNLVAASQALPPEVCATTEPDAVPVCPTTTEGAVLEAVEERAPENNIKKKKLKPNLAAAPQALQEEIRPTTEPDTAQVLPTPQAPEEVVTKKNRKQHLGKKSKQPDAREPEVLENGALPNDSNRKEPDEILQSQQPPETCDVAAAVTTDNEAQKPSQDVTKQKKKSRPQLNGITTSEQQPKTVIDADQQQSDKQQNSKQKQPAQLKVVVSKMDVVPVLNGVGTLSPASKAILQKAQLQVKSVATSPAARRLFDEPEAQSIPQKEKAPKDKRGADAVEAVTEESRNKRKEAKRAKLKSSVPVMEPIPKVRISAERDGIYRITTPAKGKPHRDSSAELNDAERLTVTESESSPNVRTSLEDNPEDFLGFEDKADEGAEPDNVTVDLSQSNVELVIRLEPAVLPEGVQIQESSEGKKKQRRRSQSPARKAASKKKEREPRLKRASMDAPMPSASASKGKTEPEKNAAPERPTVASNIDNRSLPLKKRKSRDNSQECRPPTEQVPQQQEEAQQAPVDLNDSMLIPMLQRVPIADKYVVRSSPDRGTESSEYETDNGSYSGDNVLIVRKDTSRLDQSRLQLEDEPAPSLKRKKDRRESAPLPRFYGDNACDLTWRPLKKKAKRLRTDNDSGIEEEDVVRRSSRTCRISKQILMTNPLIKSAYDRPNYRPMSVDQLVEAERLAKKLQQEEKAKRRKATNAKATDPTKFKGRKRVHESTEQQEGQQIAKKNRTDLVAELPEAIAGTSTDAVAGPSGLQVQAESLQQEKQHTEGWMMKLMAVNAGREEVMPQATSSGDRMHFQLDHLTFQERNGIQYSFFIYSETENFGFLRFAPAAVKKWTKTADFLLKFLILHGQLSFQINGKETVTKAGDFLMLPQNTRYRIQNSDEISLIFMIKFRAAQNELPSL